MNFEELSDEEWLMVSSLVSDEPPIRLNRRGRPRAEPRIVANAVLWILTTGESWSRLPARYPSGPTCRRRFDEWHVNGTLIEVVKRLTQVGRQFIYVPEPVVPAVPAASLEVAASSACAGAVTRAAQVEDAAEDDGLPAVYWKSPEAWQAPASVVADAPLADAMESMTRQLAGPVEPASTQNATPKAAPKVATAVAPAAASAAPTRASTPVPVPYDESPATARRTLWTSDGKQSVQIAEWRGYVINLTVQPVRNRMYRAAVEILKDDKRVERSGLIGPRFQDRDPAKRFAYDWARKWIERECRGASHSSSVQSAHRTVGTTVTRSPNAVVTRPALPSAPGTPGNVRLAPLQRYTVASPLLPGKDSSDADAGASSSTAERRNAEAQYGPFRRTLAG